MSIVAQTLANLIAVKGWDGPSKAQLDAIKFSYAARLIGGNYV